MYKFKYKSDCGGITTLIIQSFVAEHKEQRFLRLQVLQMFHAHLTARENPTNLT